MCRRKEYRIRIFHIHQKQSLSRSGSPGFATVFLFYNSPEALNGKLSTPHFNQCAHYGTHHIPQKAVGPDGKHPSGVLFPCPFRMGNMADICLYIRMQFAETRKVSIFEKHFRRLIHTFIIQRTVNPAAILPVERIFGSGHIIFVSPGCRIKTRMSLRPDTANTINRNIRR